MGNTSLFPDIDNNPYVQDPTTPEESGSGSLFSIFDEGLDNTVPSDVTIPDENSSGSLFPSLETDENFNMTVEDIEADPTIVQDAASAQQEVEDTSEPMDERLLRLFEREMGERGSEEQVEEDANDLVEFTEMVGLRLKQQYGYTDEQVAEELAKGKGFGSSIKKLTLDKEEAKQLSQEKIDSELDVDINLLYERLNSKNFVTSGLTNKLLDAADAGVISLNQLNWIVFADEVLNPVTTVVNVPEHFANVADNISAGEFGKAAGNAALGVLDSTAAIPGVKLLTSGITKTWKAVGNGGDYNRIQDAIANETQIAEDLKAANKAKAAEENEIRQQLIQDFEERNMVDISRTDANGHRVVDGQKVREAGKTKLTEYYIDDIYVGTDNKSAANPLDDIFIGDHEMAIPYLNPDKMNALVSVVADLRDAGKIDLKGKGTLVDKLFDATVDGDLFESEELYNMLTKAGMSYEEYMLGVVSSASQAGKILNRASQMARYKPKGVKEREAELARQATSKGLSKFWSNTVLRGENIRRGLLVSSLSTAMRNLQSGAVRSPMESLGNVMDTGLIVYAKAVNEGNSTAQAIGKFTKAVNPLVRDGTWSDSFRSMKYLFADQNTAEQFTDYVLDRPQLASQFERLNSSIAELRELTGRGQATTKVGKGFDKVASALEDGVEFLNGPNRWQEMMIRRSTFFSELERITNAEWGINLRKTLDEGRIQDVINDAPALRGEGGRSFVSIVDEAVTKSLDVTYAKAPEFPPFKYMSDLITKTGLTAIVPFPRFMFNSMEYMAQSAGGAGIMAIRKAMFKDARGVITARDRQDISRNLVGVAALTGLYQYRNSEFAGERYESVEFEDKQVDLTPIFPMRQMGWIAEFAKQYNQDTLSTWYGADMDHIAEVFIGTTARTGTGNVIVDEIGSIIKGTEDETDKNKRARAIGAAVGQYVNTFFTPFFQFVDAQRAQGTRSIEYRDAANDPTLTPDWGEAFGQGFNRSLIQRGLASPSYEEEMPFRVSIDTGSIKRFDPATKLFTGLNIKDADNDITEYLLQLGYEDPTYELGSRARIPSEKRAENAFLSGILPTLANTARDISENMSTDLGEQRKIADKYLVDMLNEAKQQFIEDGYASPYAMAVDELSRVPKRDRDYARILFKQFNEGREPDVRNIRDIRILIELADDVTK